MRSHPPTTPRCSHTTRHDIEEQCVTPRELAWFVGSTAASERVSESNMASVGGHRPPTLVAKVRTVGGNRAHCECQSVRRPSNSYATIGDVARIAGAFLSRPSHISAVVEANHRSDAGMSRTSSVHNQSRRRSPLIGLAQFIELTPPENASIARWSQHTAIRDPDVR